MDRKLKRWEMALMLGLLCALVGGSWLGQEQHELADSVIRFHVIANSDSAQDQTLKLAVRDRVLEEAQDAPVCLYPAQVEASMVDTGQWGRIPVYRVRVGEQSDPTGGCRATGGGGAGL